MKGTLKLKLATLAVILAAAVLVPTAQAGTASATLVTSNDGSDAPFSLYTINAGDFTTQAFYVKVSFEGSAGGPPSGSRRIKVCNNITLNADGSFTCTGFHTFYLAHNFNYNGGAVDANGLSFPQYVPVGLAIAEGVPCSPPLYDLQESLLAYSGTGIEFSNGLLSLNLPFQVEVSCDLDWQGCSHGYWKNHTQSWEGWSYSDMVSDAFAWPYADMTMLQAMQFTGPGNTVEDASRILLQQAVASLLNADHSDVNFPMDSADLISAVNAALASGDRDAILALKDELDTKNNLGCPLN